MALKRKVTKEEFDKLPEVLKAEYEEKNGMFHAIIDGDDDAIEAIKRAKEHESESHKETKRKLKELEDRLSKDKYNSDKSNNDVAAIEKSWQDKFSARETELLGKNKTIESMLSNSLKDSVISSIASELVKTDSQRIFKKAVADRFVVEMDGDAPKIRIMDREGKPSAMSLEDFKKEVLADKEYTSILNISKASGGAGVKPGHSVNALADDKPVDLSKLPPREMAARIKANKENK